MPSLLPKPIEFKIQGKYFAGELWGDGDGQPVIALHGWLDNCHSFHKLAPLLTNTQLLALDMAGHGHSEHRSLDASYHIWDDVREILLIAKEMGWNQFSLLGHSRGAIIAVLIAAVAAREVKRLILIEGMLPQTCAAVDSPRQLRKFLDRYLSWNDLSDGYESIDPLVGSRTKAGWGLTESTARLLIERNIKQVGSRFYWRTDPRLMMPSPQMLTNEAAEAYWQAVSAPTLLILASEGFGKGGEVISKMLNPGRNINVMILPGNHHLHMEGNIYPLAECINGFMGVEI